MFLFAQIFASHGIGTEIFPSLFFLYFINCVFCFVIRPKRRHSSRLVYAFDTFIMVHFSINLMKKCTHVSQWMQTLLNLITYENYTKLKILRKICHRCEFVCILYAYAEEKDQFALFCRVKHIFFI